MSKKVEYAATPSTNTESSATSKEYFPFGEGLIAQVDYRRQVVFVDALGGWGRRYEKTFAQLAELASSKWMVSFDPAAPEAELVEAGARIIMAEDAISTGNAPDLFLKIPDALSEEEKRIVSQFESLIDTHGGLAVHNILNKDSFGRLCKRD